MEEMKELIENYKFNYKQASKFRKKLNELLEYNTSITAMYGHNTGGSRGTVNSKVENCIMRIAETKVKLYEYEHKVEIVDKAERVLNKKEKEVIELIKSGWYNKVTIMSKILGKDKDYIVTRRDRAIKKMSEFTY